MTWHLIATGFAFISIRQLYKAYLEINVFGYDYNWMYTTLFSCMTLYLIIYLIYLNKLLTDSKHRNQHVYAKNIDLGAIRETIKEDEKSNG